MHRKLVKIAVIVLTVALAACSQNSNKSKGERSSSTALKNYQQTESQPDVGQRAPATDLKEEIEKLYTGVTVLVTNLKTKESQTVVIPFNNVVEVPSTSLKISVEQFYPDFIMSPSGYTTLSMDLNNPAAKVNIVGDDQEFDGWLFQLYPGMHPYENDNFTVLLSGTIAK